MTMIEEASVEQLHRLWAACMIRLHDIPEYGIWKRMKQRCRDPNTNEYRYYGGRGISVCDAWQNNFWSWFHHLGRRPYGLMLERIDNDGHYEPGNVKWATPREQNNNKRMDNLRKLTREDVEEIRSMRGVATSTALAFDYGVASSVIISIWRNKTWTDGQDIPQPTKLKSGALGSANGLSVIHENDALLIKMLLAEGQLTAREIADEVGTTKRLVENIKYGHTWRQVQLPEDWKEQLSKLDEERKKQWLSFQAVG
jgi:hypothetical protein